MIINAGMRTDIPGFLANGFTIESRKALSVSEILIIRSR